MDLELARSFLLWCTVLNVGFALLWFLLLVFLRDWVHRVHGRWFSMSREQFDRIHYTALVRYRLGILLFNLVPLIALWIIT